MMDQQSSIKEVLLILTQKRDTLRLDREGLKVDFDELKRECTVLKENVSLEKNEIEWLLLRINSSCTVLYLKSEPLDGVHARTSLGWDKTGQNTCQCVCKCTVLVFRI
jgi:hypothetical protein